MFILYIMPRHHLPPSCGGRGKETERKGGGALKEKREVDRKDEQPERNKTKKINKKLSCKQQHEVPVGENDIMVEDRIRQRKEKVICIRILWQELFICKWGIN